MILQYRSVHKTCATCPVVFGKSVRYDGHIGEVRHGSRLGLYPVVHVKVRRSATTPVEGDRARDALVLHVFENGLDGGKASA